MAVRRRTRVCRREKGGCGKDKVEAHILNATKPLHTKRGSEARG
jgi:hypothetical protein